MFISLKKIKDLFQDYEAIIYGDSAACCLSCFEMLIPSLYLPDEHILYVTDQLDHLLAIQPQKGSHFLYLSDGSKLPSEMDALLPLVHVLHIRTTDLALVHERLLNFFQISSAYGLFSDSLLETLAYENGIQAMIDTAYNAFKNPIFVFDAGFHLTAASWEAAANDIINESLLYNKAFSETEFQLINKLNHIHEKVKKSEIPVQIRHPELSFDQLVCAIDTQKDVGHIVINATNHPFTEADHHMLLLLKRAIDQQLKKDEFIRNNKGFPYEYFIKDLLDEKIAVGQNHFDTMKYVKKEFHGILYCIVVETARSSNTISLPYVRNDFETFFSDCKTLVYNGEIIILLCHPQKQLLTAKEYKKLTSLCKKHKLFAGISNAFSNILAVKDYYMQALRAIELGISREESPNLFVYSHYYMKHISNLFLQKEAAPVFSHPQLTYLIQYDNENHTDYAKSLYTYLIHERNSVLAAKALDVHPNTLRYRLKNIEKMIHVDLEDAQERQYLIISYEVSRHSK